MGVIHDGSVSGSLPCAEAFAVHYPGYPSSMSQAMETLGGTDAILKAHSNPSNKLELHFRPKDPYSHPAFGELLPCNNLLLKISRRKSVNTFTSKNCTSEVEVIFPTNSKQKNYCPKSIVSVQEADKHENGFVSIGTKLDVQACSNISADIVARVSEAYHFKGMVDYQYVLPVHSAGTRNKKRSRKEIEPEIRKDDLMNMYHEDLLILLPTLFSLKDIPKKVVLRPSAISNLKEHQEVVVPQHCEMDIEQSFDIDFKTEEIPKKSIWEDHFSQESYQWELQVAVSKLFDERPIWTKSAIRERLLDQDIKVGDYLIRRLLFISAYSFSYGPFKKFCIKRGYDPRNDSESRLYQTIDFRVPQSLRNYCEVNSANGLKQNRKDICEFRVFPYQCQTSLQLFELADEYIQQEIRKPVKQATCTCATGWFSKAMYDHLKLRIKVKFLSIYPQSGAEALLKSVTADFEKSKWLLIHKVDSPQEDGGKPHSICANVVRSGDDKKEESDDETEDDDGEDNDEEEEAEEEEEDEEDLNEDGEEGEARTDEDEYNKMSRRYLEDLFGTFLPNQASSSSKDVQDQEYEIYGQYDDENYLSDDDDDDDEDDDDDDDDES